MKVQFFLFLIFITYSENSIQEIYLGCFRMETLKSSIMNDYFFFYTHLGKDENLLLIDDNYDMNDIYYCSVFIHTLPTESTIKNCSFNILYPYDSRNTSKGIEYYYNITSSSKYNYIIIRYSGSKYKGNIKACALYADIKKIPIGSFYETNITRIANTYAFFYSSIEYPHPNYLYFNITDRDTQFDKSMHYCFSHSNPESNFFGTINRCDIFSLSYYNKTKNKYGLYEYYYKVDVSHYDTINIIIVKFGFCSSTRQLYAQNSYDEYGYTPSSKTKPLSTLTIVFIVTGAAAFLGIIITVIFYYCRKKEVNNITYTPNEPAEGRAAPSPYPLMQ